MYNYERHEKEIVQVLERSGIAFSDTWQLRRAAEAIQILCNTGCSQAGISGSRARNEQRSDSDVDVVGLDPSRDNGVELSLESKDGIIQMIVISATSLPDESEVVKGLRRDYIEIWRNSDIY